MNERYARPSAEMILRDLGTTPRLSVYLASAPGAGKTHRLLQEARRLSTEGLRVFIGWIETKNRPDLEELARDLPRIPPRIVRIGSSEFADFDYDAAIAAAPQLIILDELAHANLEGGRHAKRWQDALALRAAGINVSGALNVIHLETVAPIAERQIGFPVREVVPMDFLRKAEQVIALDVSEEELQTRLLSGRILHPEDIERARNGVFHPQTQRLLREMMLRTIDELTVPQLSPAKTSTALALLPKDTEPGTLIARTQQLATALDLSPEIAMLEPNQDISSIAAEHGARVITLPNFEQSKPNLAEIRATLIVVPNGPLAQRIAGSTAERDVFVVNTRMPEASTEHSLFSGVYAQTAGDRMRIGYGRLTIYLGAAAGCGKTYAMLDRAHRLKAAGVDVAAALVETHKRAETEKLLDGLEILPRRTVSGNGIEQNELDLAALLARKPEVALIDELAHTNHGLHDKRYEDVLTVLRAGISVMTTLNIQHLEGLNDAVFRLTGTRVRETVPDEIMRLADDVIFIDVAPEALRERLRQGKIYSPPERIETALANFFRIENLAALRELCLREVIRARGKLPAAVPVGHIALGVKGRERDIQLIARCARLAQRFGTEMSVIHVARERDSDLRTLDALEAAAERVRARWELVRHNDPVAGLLQSASSMRAATIALEGRQGKARWPTRATFARRLLDAGAEQIFMLTPTES